MTTVVSVCDETGHPLLTDVLLADSHWLKFKGLMFQSHLNEDQGMLLTKCNAIHCWFMRIPIDVLFLNREGVVLRVMPTMKPWRFSPIVRNAVSVLECSAGTVERLQIYEGQVLKLKNHHDA